MDFRSTAFSDCIVLSEAVDPKALQYLLFRVSQFALDLLASGFLLRGAIAKGLLRHSERVIFGPAFLNAYDSERNVAKYPRIVVDRGTHEDFLNLPNAKLNEVFERFIRPDLRHADDGPVFVDIFSGYRIAGHIPHERVRMILARLAARAFREKSTIRSIIPRTMKSYAGLRFIGMAFGLKRIM